MKNRIDLNSDVGESFGRYSLGMDTEVIPLITSANIACGFHAGDPVVMRRTVELARRHGTAPGAHPGLPDLMGFGRRSMDVSLAEIRDYVVYQVGAIQAFAQSLGVPLQHVKPHGALYNMAVANPAIWETVIRGISELNKDLIVVVLAGPDRDRVKEAGARYGIRTAFEFFGDRAYNPDGSLVSRKNEGAVIQDNQIAAGRVLRMIQEGRVSCVDGTDIEMTADTVCVHGDNPTALALVRKIRQTCEDAGVAVTSMGSFV